MKECLKGVIGIHLTNRHIHNGQSSASPLGLSTIANEMFKTFDDMIHPKLVVFIFRQTYIGLEISHKAKKMDGIIITNFL